MAYIKELQDQANYYNSKANSINSSIPSSSGAGYTTPPKTSDSAEKEFSGDSGK